MTDVAERVERAEGRMDAHQQGLADLRSTLQQFEARVDTRFGQIDGRFLQVDGRIITLDQKMDGRIGALEQKMDERFGQIDARWTRA